MVVCCLLMQCMNGIMSLANKYPCILLVSLYTCEIEYWEQAYICAFAEPIVPCTQCCTTCVIILRLPEITLCSWLGIKYQVLRLTYHYNDSYNTLQDEYVGIIHDAFLILLCWNFSVCRWWWAWLDCEDLPERLGRVCWLHTQTCCLDLLLQWSICLLVTKLGMEVHHHELEYHERRLTCYLQEQSQQGLIKNIKKCKSTVSTVFSELLILQQPNLVWLCRSSARGTCKMIGLLCWRLRLHQRFRFPMKVCWDISMVMQHHDLEFQCKMIGLLSSRLRSKLGLR